MKKIWKRIKRIFLNSVLMSIGMGLNLGGHYEKDEPPIQLTTPESEAAVGQLQNLSTTTPNLPSVNLPGISGTEQQLLNQGMSLIKQLMSGEMPEAFQIGMEKIKSVLGGEYNPLTSPYYKGLKEEAARTEEKGISDIRQRSQLGGMLYSEPAMGAEAEFKGIMGTGLTKELGSLYEADINRQTNMIPQLLGYSQQEMQQPLMGLQGISAMAPLAGKGGDIARQQEMLNWQQATQQELFPWTTQAPILEALADYGNWYTKTKTYQPGLLW